MSTQRSPGRSQKIPCHVLFLFLRGFREATVALGPPCFSKELLKRAVLFHRKDRRKQGERVWLGNN